MTQREYIWLDDLPVAVVDSVAALPVIYYVHTDHLFRPVAMTNAAQNVAWSASYTPFGAVQTTNVQTATLDLRFPGQWYELETGLHYNWHRHYDPTTGRYLQPDPLGFVNGPSVYSYAGGSPLAKIDPMGLDPVGAAIGGLIGRAAGGAAGEAIDPFGGGILGAIAGGRLGSAVGDALGDLILMMAKAGIQDYENEYSREARLQPDPCGWLRAKYNEASDSVTRNKIKLAQKVLGCRPSSATKDECKK